MKYTVKRVSIADVPAIIPEIVRVFSDDEVVPWHRYDECLETVTRRLGRGFYITVALCDGKIAGYSEWIETHDCGKTVLYLGLMQVDPDLRGRGVGCAMLADGEKHARSIGASHLRTSPEDERAHDFYRKHGFTDADDILHCTLATVAVQAEAQSAEPPAMTVEIADTHELIFGVVQSSSRHMYEVANHNPPESAFRVKTARVENGYLQFRYRESADTAMALYWCNKTPTAATLDAILAQGYAAGFKELEIYVKSRYAYLFTNQNLACESIEIERKIMETIDKNTLIHERIDLTRDTEYVLECHCRVNYDCDTPWAREVSYENYRARWYNWDDQQAGFIAALRESMEDARTIAEIVKTPAGEVVGYLWVAFHGEDAAFIWADAQDIYIEPQYRRMGLAEYLMEYAENMARQNSAQVLRSGTGCENRASIDMHEKLGFYQYRYEYEKLL